MTDLKKEQDPKKTEDVKAKDGKKDSKAPVEEELVIAFNCFSKSNPFLRVKTIRS